MRRLLVLGLITLLAIIILYACNMSSQATQANPNTFSGTDLPSLGLTVAVQNANSTFNTVGQPINYAYTVTNTGTPVLTGPVTVASDKGPVTCAAVNTVGDLDNDLDGQESLTCSSTYAITQADLNNGSVTNNSTAAAGGINSNTVATPVQMTLSPVLSITNVANPTTYNQAAQVITFTYSIKNIGTAALGPAQFVIKDDRLGMFNCGGAATIVGTNESFTCTATYNTTSNDVGVSQLTFTTTASGGSATTAQPVKVNVTNTGVPGTGGGSTTLTRGTTIPHQVNEGEWLLQIARCYGADFNTVRNANPQILDPDKIWPVDKLSIPNIGSNGTIYGPPCVTYYIAQAGDTWNSIAQKYNADLAVLLEANKTVTLAAGVRLKIPINSAGGNPIPPGNEPIRINFPAGSNTVTLSGTVQTAKVKERYVFTASSGQSLSLKVTAPATELNLAVLAANGAVLKAQDATLTFTGTIPANGDYYIDIINITAADKLYQLEISLTTPVVSVTTRAADINTGAGDSNPAYLAVFNGTLYFNATGNDNAGAELWKYPVTANTATRVADIVPGADGSSPSFLTEYKGALYFGAKGNDGAGVELWRFNGTDVGRLGDINAGAENANPSYMTVFNDRLYFSAKSSDGTGVELWQTDGTNVNRVADIYTGSGDSNPAHLAVFNGALYFSAISNDGAGNELWKFDGTTATRVTDINTGVGNSTPAYLAVLNNVLYFSATGSDGAGNELWKFDGTNASRAADINAGAGDSIPAYLTIFNGALYFSANGNDGKGFELWKFDGTTASRVSDLNPTGDAFPAFLRVYNSQLYFQANGNDGTGKELWKYNGQ